MFGRPQNRAPLPTSGATVHWLRNTVLNYLLHHCAGSSRSQERTLGSSAVGREEGYGGAGHHCQCQRTSNRQVIFKFFFVNLENCDFLHNPHLHLKLRICKVSSGKRGW